MSVKDQADRASEYARETAAAAREKALEAYDSARDGAVAAKRKAGDGIDEAPLIALAGGLAVGALIAALLPKTAKETALLGSVGVKITDAREGKSVAHEVDGHIRFILRHRVRAVRPDARFTSPAAFFRASRYTRVGRVP